MPFIDGILDISCSCTVQSMMALCSELVTCLDLNTVTTVSVWLYTKVFGRGPYIDDICR